MPRCSSVALRLFCFFILYFRCSQANYLYGSSQLLSVSSLTYNFVFQIAQKYIFCLFFCNSPRNYTFTLEMYMHGKNTSSVRVVVSIVFRNIETST